MFHSKVENNVVNAAVARDKKQHKVYKLNANAKNKTSKSNILTP